MPSDDRSVRALEALAGDRDAFRSAVARTVDEVGGMLERAGAREGGERSRRALGPMARGRIDPERFAGLLGEEEALDPKAAEQLERAREVLADVHGAGDDPYHVRLEEGGSLRDAVAEATARLGRAFGAARTVELARSGRWRPEDHGSYLEAFPFGMWNGHERAIAPPVVVELSGRDLWPAALCEYVDGSTKIVLIVEGAAPPAALVRLVTPGVTVVQTDDPDDLSALSDREGSAVAALFDGSAGAARFAHRPGPAAAADARFSLEDLPEEADVRPVGTMSRAQQIEELRQLQALARSTAGTRASENGAGPDAAGEATEAEPADRLAGWLLRQSGLDQVEG